MSCFSLSEIRHDRFSFLSKPFFHKKRELGRMQISLGLKSAFEQMQSKFLTEKEKHIYNLLQHTESFLDFEKLIRSFAILLAAHEDIDHMYPALIQTSGPANANFRKCSLAQ